MTPTQLHCPTTYPNDSTHPSTLITTHNSITHPYPLYNFFRNILLQQLLSLIIIFHQHHHPSLLLLPPSTLLTTPTNFNFSISVNQLRQLHLFHSIHRSVQFYLCDFHCYVSILSLTQLDLEKFTSCDFLFFFVLHCPFRLLHSIHVSVHFYISIFATQFPLLSLTQHGFEKFHPCYLVVFSFYFSYFTHFLDPMDLRE